MNEVILNSTVNFDKIFNYRIRSNSAPAWITEQIKMEEYDFASDTAYENKSDENTSDENNQTDDLPKEIKFINILSYLIVCAMIFSCFYASVLILTEINKNPNFSIFLGSWIFTVSLSLLFITSIFVSDINDEVSYILEAFINQPIKYEKKNN